MSAVYTIEFAPVAAREFRKLTRQTQQQLQLAITALKSNPCPAGVVKLESRRDLYRVRSGDYRIVYEIQDQVLLVTLVKIANRREVYR